NRWNSGTDGESPDERKHGTGRADPSVRGHPRPLAPARSRDEEERGMIGREARGRSRGAWGAIAPLALGIVVVLAWEAAARAGLVDPFFLPAPADILTRLGDDLTGPNRRYLGPTLAAAGWGSVLAAAVAIPLGIAIASSRLARRLLEPYVAASQALPAVAV